MDVGDKYTKKSDGTVWTVVTWGDVSVTITDGHTHEYPSRAQLKTQYTKKK